VREKKFRKLPGGGASTQVAGTTYEVQAVGIDTVSWKRVWESPSRRLALASAKSIYRDTRRLVRLGELKARFGVPQFRVVRMVEEVVWTTESVAKVKRRRDVS
jgi:hypothetical protein